MNKESLFQRRAPGIRRAGGGQALGHKLKRRIRRDGLMTGSDLRDFVRFDSVLARELVRETASLAVAMPWGG